MTVRVRHRGGVVVGSLDAWDERGCVVGGQRIEGPLLIEVLR